MDPQDFYLKCLEQTTAIVTQVQPDQLANETPDDEWTVRDLANHILYEVSWVPDMLEGKTVAQVGGKYDGDLFEADVANAQTNLLSAWQTAASKAEQAVRDVDPNLTVHMSYADDTAASYLQQTGGDILVHAWDLAKAIGVPIEFDPAVAAYFWEQVKQYDMPSNLFKPAKSVADDASDQEKILAHLGRDSDWQPAA